MHMEMCPPDVASAMSPAQAEMMPGGPGPMADMDGDGMPPPAWGDGAAAGGSPLDGMAPMGDPMGAPPMGGDPMGDAMGGPPMGDAPMGDPGAPPPAFDGAMAAMDTAASANMAEGMEAANTAADAADAAAADAPADDAPTDDVV